MLTPLWKAVKRAHFQFGEKWKINLLLLSNSQIFLVSALLSIRRLTVTEHSAPFTGNGNLFRGALKIIFQCLRQIIIDHFIPRLLAQTGSALKFKFVRLKCTQLLKMVSQPTGFTRTAMTIEEKFLKISSRLNGFRSLSTS